METQETMEMPSQTSLVDMRIEKKPSESIFALIAGYRPKMWANWALGCVLAGLLLWVVSSIKAAESRLEAQSDRITRVQTLVDTLQSRPDFNQQVDVLTTRVGRMEQILEELAQMLKSQHVK